MKLEKGKSITPFLYSRTERPWGFFDVYGENVQCTTKLLYVKKDEALSLQWHFKRSQLYTILDDCFIIHYSTIEVPEEILNEPNDHKRIPLFNSFLDTHLVEVEAKEGDEFFFNRRVLHRALYKGPREYGRFLDVAFGTNMEEGDIYRVSDKYGREDIKNIKV